MALGLGFGFGFERLKGVRSTTIYVPIITWDGDATDSRPDFDVDIPSGNGAPHDAAEDDVIRLEYSSNGGSSWNAYLTHTVTAGEVGGDPITVSGVSPLASGSYLFRARLERGLIVGAWSASEDVVIVIVVSNKRNVILVMRAR